jgi:hypothetical protein
MEGNVLMQNGLMQNTMKFGFTPLLFKIIRGQDMAFVNGLTFAPLWQHQGL